jgi:hypothetical protein
VPLSLHTSPVWMQNDDPSLHTPPLHRLEQHWLLSVHGLPAVRQAVLSGWHAPPVQLPPQQEAESAHAWPSAMHALALQRLPAQSMEQHSVDATQPPPVTVHLLIEAAQVALAGSQIPEQHSAPVAHCWVNARQEGEGVTLVASSLPALPSGYLPML